MTTGIGAFVTIGFHVTGGLVMTGPSVKGLYVTGGLVTGGFVTAGLYVTGLAVTGGR